jgi:hypothetical protein
VGRDPEGQRGVEETKWIPFSSFCALSRAHLLLPAGRI